MRENLFKGKDEKTQEWRIGSLLDFDRDSGHIYIVEPCCYASSLSVFELIRYHAHPVIPETVGRYTGLKDRNGKRIFEGDILRLYSVFPKELYRAPCVVVYGTFNCECCHGVYGWWFRNGDIRDHKRYEIIGNIHDNPELLEVEA